MAHFQDLTRRLLAAGGALNIDGEGLCMLYTGPERPILTSKLWNGSSWGSQSIIAKGIRIGSSAAYLLSPQVRLIVCISEANKLRALRYEVDEEAEEEGWVDIKDFPHFDVHALGKVTGLFLGPAQHAIIYQDPSDSLVYVDQNWSRTIIPISKPAPGTPIAVMLGDDRLRIFYISAEDRRIHDIVRTGLTSDSWTDGVVASPTFDELPVRIIATFNPESSTTEMYLLARNSQILQVSEGDLDGEAKVLGKVDADGKFNPGTSAQNCQMIYMPTNRWYAVLAPYGGGPANPGYSYFWQGVGDGFARFWGSIPWW
jgi:hypothetical protein